MYKSSFIIIVFPLYIFDVVCHIEDILSMSFIWEWKSVARIYMSYFYEHLFLNEVTHSDAWGQHSNFTSVCITGGCHKVSLCRWGFRFSQWQVWRVFWVVGPCCVVGTDWRFRRFCCLHHQGDGGSKLRWSISHCVPDYTAQHPRRQQSSLLYVVYISIIFGIFSTLLFTIRVLLPQSGNFYFHL
jgi:hypothetical protein